MAKQRLGLSTGIRNPNTLFSNTWQKVCGSSMMIVNVDPPVQVDATICNSTDFLIADNDYIGN